MTTEYAPKKFFSSQTGFKNQLNYIQQESVSKSSSLYPSLIIPNPKNNFLPNVSFAKSTFFSDERRNSYFSDKISQDNNLCENIIFPIRLNNSALFGAPMKDSFIQSNIFFKEDSQKKYKINPNIFLLNINQPKIKQNDEDSQIDILKKEKNLKERLIDIQNNILNETQNKIESNHKENNLIEETNNEYLKSNVINNNNFGTKFFTNHNYGYKCSCTKTQCNRKYCECFNSGNYCIDCNCKNCFNKPPKNTYSNKHPLEVIEKTTKSKEICTCTKSGCNKNYCECFKNGNKCTSLCRCRGCENIEGNEKLIKNKKNLNYECCSENSIYIIKNKISINNIEINDYNENDYFKFYELFEDNINKFTEKKRKREEMKNQKINLKNDKNIEKIKTNFNESLLNSNRKVILQNINMFYL